MFSCEKCDKQFKTKSALAGHQRTHGPSRGSYSLSRKTGRNYSSFNCLHCQKEGHHYPTVKLGKFCNRQCQADHQWSSITKIKIISGSCTNKGQLKRYLRELHGDKCELCPQGPIHNGKPLVLQLDHINGNSDDNSVSNLRLLCPNCHTQTETYGSKGNLPGIVKDTSRNRYLRTYQKTVDK